MATRTIQAMALTLADREVHPLTAEQVIGMVDAGILAEDERVELLCGVLTAVSAKSPEHGAIIMRLVAWLDPGGAAGVYEVWTEHPFSVPDPTSLPEPDIAVIAAGHDPRRYPTSARLVIEVAVSSLQTDTKVKPALYAAAGVPELWVVDVRGRRVRIFSEPESGGYAAERTQAAGRLEPSNIAVDPLDVETLFTGL